MKKILDACCGSRMFWFDRENQDVLFADNRELETTLSDGRALLVKPDIKMDFREMPFPDNTFKIVVFDPPHLKQAGSESWLAKKYGVLPKDWKPYLKAGFDECMRVLEPDGILVFKWNEEQIKLKLEKYWYLSNYGCLGLNRCLNVDFPMIKWEDDEPWLIEDLKKLEVVDEY